MQTEHRKLILHLCADIGSDSRPYRDAGYEVICIGKGMGVENYHPPKEVYGIIANPPCTMFSSVRTTARTPRDLRIGMIAVQHCLRIIWECQYKLSSPNSKQSPLKFWALENPGTGLLRWFLGKPAFIYQPYEFGEDYSKKTAIWGMFNPPVRPLFFTKPPKGNCLAMKYNRSESDGKRSVCSAKFAKAFFEANP